MAIRSVVLVLLHARRALGALCLSVLVAQSADAATNGWSVPGFGTCFEASHGDISAAALCHRSSIQASLDAHPADDVVCSHEVIGVNTSSNPYIGHTRVNYALVGGCGSPSVSDVTTWQFTFEAGPGCETYDATIHGCEIPPPDCNDFAGTQVDRYFADTGPGGAICATPPGEEVMGCEALVANPTGTRACAGGECFARLSFTGDQCGAEPDATSETLVDQPGSTNCVAGDGVTVCAATSSQNCGTVNGQAVCLDSVPPGACTFLGNGGMVCASSASSPPAPTDSGGMSPATPDGTFTAGSDDTSDTTYNYFGPGTVSDSGTPVSGPAQGGGGDEGTEEPSDDEFTGPDLGETTTFAEALGAFAAGLDSVPFVAAVNGLGGSMPEGECPAPTVEIPYLDGVELTLDAHCGLWDEISPILTGVMLAIWVFLGARILLSA